MSMTEAEARERWCPFAMALTGNRTVSYNRRPEDGAPSIMAHCIASKCMAWRWDIEVHGLPVKGYCGLAGSPR